MRFGLEGLVYNYYRYYDPETGRYITSDPIGLSGGVNTYAYVENNPLIYIDPLGLDWFRPNGHPYLTGREGTIVEPGRDSNGSLNLGGYIDDYVPAGHSFASIHDRTVGDLTQKGIPDWLANIPTMPKAYSQAFLQELMNSSFQLFDSDLFKHELDHDFDACQ